ncbi:hypothetical protein VR46_12560 [Streptomyces sp. NRRL S-444]|nr:hypothetical protein VR46_12560 [Streptomyces sp. NRRL S-444]
MNSTTVSPQPAAMSSSRSRSAPSAARPQRSLVSVHSAAYRHSASGAGGSHCAGSRAALDRFERAVTASREDSGRFGHARNDGCHRIGALPVTKRT